MKDRQPDQPEESQDYSEESLKACAQDLIDAIKAEDVDKVAQVLKDAHELCDTTPHEEAEHINEEENPS